MTAFVVMRDEGAYMRKPTFVAAALLAFVLTVLTCAAQSQAYPNKPVHIITTEAGGGGDVAGRLIAPGLSTNLGQQVVVENRGGHPINSAGFVAKAAPDGYTLLLHGAT